MKILIEHGRVIDSASGRDERADVAIAAGRIVGIGRAPGDFKPERRIDASGCVVMPGLIDLAVRLREPGHEHEGMLESEMAAAVAGGVTTSPRASSVRSALKSAPSSPSEKMRPSATPTSPGAS